MNFIICLNKSTNKEIIKNWQAIVEALKTNCNFLNILNILIFPEVIQKNCELFAPETIKNTVQAFVIFSEKNKYKGILVLTEYRLIFKEQNPIDIKLQENYFKFPLMSIAKLDKIENPKSDYDTYIIDMTLKDTRDLRFYVKDNIHSTFYLNLENSNI